MTSNNSFWSYVLFTLHLTVGHIGTYVPYGNYLGSSNSYIRGSGKYNMFYYLGLRKPKIKHRLSSRNLHTIPPLPLERIIFYLCLISSWCQVLCSAMVPWGELERVCNLRVCPCTQTESIVHTERWSYGIFTRPYNPNNLTIQSTAANDAPRDPIYAAPLHGILPLTRTHVYIRLGWYIYVLRYQWTTNTVTVMTRLLRRHWNSPTTWDPSSASTIFCRTHFPIWLKLNDSTHDLWFDYHFPIRLPFSNSSQITRGNPEKLESWNV